MNFTIQPTLQNNNICLYPLQETDFEALYNLASNPKVWEQHPNKDRWKEEVFRVFFEGAMQSKGAFKVVDTTTGNVMGSSRYYNYNNIDNSILIGYTFYGIEYWGKGINPTVKAMMLDYIFQFVEKVQFNIGAQNIRSQIAISRLGAIKIEEKDITYYGESSTPNVVYEITKQLWTAFQK